MRPVVLAVAGAFVMAASLAQAQTTTADGVDAFVRGDYPRAVEILKPAAESWPGDPVAAFFMATLYESGRGVPGDPLSACALYVRAFNSPFSRQAESLAQAFFLTSRSAIEECTLLAQIGFDHAFQPVTFTLEQGHWIAVDIRGATVTYEGKEKRIDLGLATGGIRFLPVEHTELAVGPARETRRHFIEFFTWIPGQPQTWTLFWHVYEAVRNDLVPITSSELVTIAAERPPTDRFDVRALARLRVNEKGDAEWAVLKEPNQPEVIETEAERREVREERRAREAADARVDWKRVRDPQRAPELIYADAGGCSNLFVYGRSADRTEAITLRADKEVLGLSTAPRTFDLAAQHSNLEVLVHVYERPVRSWPFCTDAGVSTGPEEMWRATRGTVTIELSPPGVRAVTPLAYRATIHIAGAEFVSAAGVRVRQVQPITLTAIVGSMY